jgi:hypothetical protein
MGESYREILEDAGQRPIPTGYGLPARQGAGKEIRMTPTVCVFNRTRESFLCLSAVAAGVLPGPQPALSQVRGGLAKVACEDGIWLEPSPRVYTVGGLFPVDQVYLDQENRVIQLVEHLDPLQMIAVRCRYASVLEVRARTIYSSRTQVGDELLICSPEEVETHWKPIQEHLQVQSAWTKQEVLPCSNG